MNTTTTGTGIAPVTVTTGFNDKTKKWQMELLMERLRTKAIQHKTFPEISKAMRMSMLEKRYALDSVEKSNLQKCLDSMQHCIKVTNRQGLVERLESLSRQLSLKFMEDTSGLFISSDMFYLEIILDNAGIVEDVKVHHECKIEQQSCSELVTCLKKGDFADFTTQLEGLSSIYQLNAEIKVKSKAFVALQALETDLTTLFMAQSFHKEPHLLLHLSPVGILQKRRGGHPMKLTYFVSPYELLDIETKSMAPLTVELINSKNMLGMSVTINLEASPANKLQIQPTLVLNKDQQGRSSPSYTPMSAHNSIMLPASFVLRLNKPMPVCGSLIKIIQQKTDISFGDLTVESPILSLITKHESDGLLTNATKGLFVSLPDQNHCYFMTENRNLKGIIINSIPFTEPAHVVHILKYLRQQTIFNTLVASCIRTTNNKQDIENTTMFELSAISTQHLSIALEHPFEESMATVEFNLTDSSNIICKIYANNNINDAISMKLSKIVQKCMSIPITLRALIKSWEQENMKSIQRSLENGNFNMPLGPSDPGGRNDGKIKLERPGGNGFGGSAAGGSSVAGTGIGNGNNITGNGNNRAATVSNFTEPILFGGSGSSTTTVGNTTNSPPVSNMLNQLQTGSGSVGGSGGGGGGGSSNSGIGGSGVTASNEESYGDEKLIKRRRTEDFWKSPKSDLTNTEMLMEHSNNSSSSDSNSLGTPASSVLSEAGVATPNSNTGFSVDTMDSVGMDISTDVLIKGNSDCDTNAFPTESCDMDGLRKKIKKHSTGKDNKESDRNDERDKDKKNSSVTSSTTTSNSVSITPITSSSGLNSVLTGLERRLGIEIIPISSVPPPSIKSSITITAINSTNKSSGSDKKSSSTSSSHKRSDDRSKVDKKKKRKRDDSPMGPPDKMPQKQDALSRPISVSIKATDGAPVSPSALLRKFATSPVHGRSGSNSNLSGNTSSNTKPSPKHSPVNHNSPKHQGLASPKSGQFGTLSPKHPTSSSGSGKPSMSALKSAANSPSSKNEKSSSKSSSSSRDGSRERDRDRDKDKDRDKDRSLKYSTGSSSPKIPKSTVKLKQIYLSAAMLPSVDVLLDASSSSQDSNKSSNNQTKNRKSSLSAVIDKLKSAQNATEELPATSPTQQPKMPSGSSTSISAGSTTSPNTNVSSKERLNNSSNSQSAGNETGGPGTAQSTPKNSEYMVKPSSDGIKITINKTRTKDSSSPSHGSSSSSRHSSGSSSGSNSPKTHTGLKPGVNSGPASKKPQNLSALASQNTNKIQTGSSTGSSSTSHKPVFQRSSSSGVLGTTKFTSSKSSGSSSSDMFSKKDKNRLISKGSDRQNVRPDHVDVFKKFNITIPSQTFDSKFQIPKLSARSSTNQTSDDGKKDSNQVVESSSSTQTNSAVSISTSKPSSTHNSSNTTMSNNANSSGTGEASKMLMDFFAAKEKFSYSNKCSSDTSLSMNMPYTMDNVSTKLSSGIRSGSTTLPKYSDMPFNKDLHLYKSSSSDAMSNSAKDFRDKHFSASNPNTPTTTVAPPFPSPVTFNHPTLDGKSPSHPSPSGSPKVTNHVSVQQQINKSMRPPSAPPTSISNTSIESISKMTTSESALDFSSPTFTKFGSDTTITSTTSVTHVTQPQVPQSTQAFNKILEQRNALQQAMPSSLRKTAPPSVQVHIVKSPVPSPLVIPSPMSNSSPCITDDELMDEALVGIGSK